MSADLLHEQKDVLDVKRSYFNAICRGLNTINKNFINNNKGNKHDSGGMKVQWGDTYTKKGNLLRL